MDSLNTAPEDQAYARIQVLKYLESAARAEWIAIHHLHAELDVLQDFTLDRAKLRAVLAKWKPTNEYLQPTDGPIITMNGLKIIARHMQGLEGRKKLIWLTSANFPAMMQARSQGTATISDMYNVKNFDVIGAFNAANVALYPLDPRGICTGAFAECQGLMDNGIQPMRQVAEATGGKSFYMRNDIAAGIDEAIHDTDLTYTLGFYPAQVDLRGQPHSLRVNVKRTGIVTRYRSQYATEPPPAPLNNKQRIESLNAWVHLPLDSTDIPIQASASPLQTRRGMYQVSISFDVAALKLTEKNGKFEGSLDIAIVPDVEKKPKGLRQTVKITYTPERLAVALEKGGKVTNVVRGLNEKGKPLAKAFHVVIMDNATGKAGSVRVPIEVELAKR
jgi:VWFA-related protein